VCDAKFHVGTLKCFCLEDQRNGPQNVSGDHDNSAADAGDGKNNSEKVTQVVAAIATTASARVMAPTACSVPAPAP
jgi:hypothetical protein